MKTILLTPNKWKRIYSSRFGHVELHVDTKEYRTIMHDYSLRKDVVIPGNLLLVLGSSTTVYILTGTEEEYQKVIKDMMTFTKISFENVERLENEKQLREMAELSPIYFYGNWWENDICHSPLFLHKMNGWL